MKTSPAVLRANSAWRDKHREDHLRRRRERHAAQMSDPAYLKRRKELRDARKPQKKEYDRRYRHENAEHLDRIKKTWLAANNDLRRAISKSYKARRRAWESEGVATSELKLWAEYQPKVCFYCKGCCDASYHIDHFIPLSRGGAHVLTNLRISCPTCNLRKNSKMPDEFRAMFEEAA